MHRWYVWILAPLIIYIWTSAMFSYLGLPTHGLGTRLKVDNIEFTLWSQEKMVMDQLKELKPMYQQMILEGWWPWLVWWYGWQVCSPLNLPSLLLKALKVGNFHANFQTFSKTKPEFLTDFFRQLFVHLVDWLCDGGLHEIDIAHNLRRKSVPQVLMELSVFQVVCKISCWRIF